jgi:death on curing protein
VTESADVDHLTLDDLLDVVAGVLAEVQIRDLGLLASAAARPMTTVFGADAYPSLTDKAAALMHAVARNHALVDGNKRLAWSATRAFLLLNGRDLRYSVDDAEAFVLAVAAGEIDMPEIASWLATHLVEPG